MSMRCAPLGDRRFGPLLIGKVATTRRILYCTLLIV
jgi:hypothetical protein